MIRNDWNTKRERKPFTITTKAFMKQNSADGCKENRLSEKALPRICLP